MSELLCRPSNKAEALQPWKGFQAVVKTIAEEPKRLQPNDQVHASRQPPLLMRRRLPCHGQSLRRQDSNLRSLAVSNLVATEAGLSKKE